MTLKMLGEKSEAIGIWCDRCGVLLYNINFNLIEDDDHYYKSRKNTDFKVYCYDCIEELKQSVQQEINKLETKKRKKMSKFLDNFYE